MTFEPGKIYRLRFPTDGKLPDGTVARFPVGLPVKLVAERDEGYLCVEPYGDVVLFPKRPVWFGNEVDSEPTLEPFESEEEAKRCWNFHANPDEHRWYIDDVRKSIPDRVYCDWETGWDPSDVRWILKAAKLILTDAEGNPIYPQNIINAICDIALSILSDDNPGWTKHVSPETAREAATVAVAAVELLMKATYIVKTGCNWNLKDGKFELSYGYVSEDDIVMRCWKDKSKTVSAEKDCPKCEHWDSDWEMCGYTEGSECR